MIDEKAVSMFNKWWSMRRALHCRDADEPPPVIEECNSLKECHRWRQTVMKEIGDKVTEIQNAGMGDYKIRVLNDEINKLLIHKRMWEARIRQLGGPDLQKHETRFYDTEGLELPGSGGYLYFGSAKDLPGVRQLFFNHAPVAPEKNKEQIYKQLDDEYFGRQELDEQIILKCKKIESQTHAKKIEKWVTDNFQKLVARYPDLQEKSQEELENILIEQDFDEDSPQTHLEISEINEINLREIEKKRKELLRIYVGEIEKEEVHVLPVINTNFLEMEEYMD